MLLILGFARTYWKQIAVGILFMMALGYVGALKYEVGSAQGKVAKLQGDKDSLTTKLNDSEASYKTLQASVEDQNNAIVKLHSDSVARLDKSTKALAQAQVNNKILIDKAAWLVIQLNKPDNTECKSALSKWRSQS